MSGDPSPDVTPCRRCPLRPKQLFMPFDECELAFMERFKVGELNVGPGVTLLEEGQGSAHLYTVLRGLGMRMMSDNQVGRNRQASWPLGSAGGRA